MAYLVGQQPAAFLVGPRSGSHKCEAMLMTYSGFLEYIYGRQLLQHVQPLHVSM